LSGKTTRHVSVVLTTVKHDVTMETGESVSSLNYIGDARGIGRNDARGETTRGEKRREGNRAKREEQSVKTTRDP
jgi:hypothetical protein